MTNTQHNTSISNVLVIGSGGAGLRAAIEAKLSGLEVIVIGKREKRDVHSVLAAGGINAAFGNLDYEDSWEQHFADTYIEGYGIGDSRLIEIMAKESPELVTEIDQWGANFEKLTNGKIDQRFFGAHTYRRTCYSGDYTGKSILYALLSKAKSLGIKIYDSEYVTDLLLENKICFGAMSFNTRTAERTVHLADSVVLAAGGHTRIWNKSSSRKGENNGDGFYLALKAGCSLIDMEMVQFHPTGILKPEDMAGTLVTEAVRGEGGRLFNKNGERFMSKYDPQRMELSTRDRVAIANYREITEGRATENGGVYLDISHKDKDYILAKLPRIYRQIIDLQMIDISKSAIEVAPTAHYSMGGIEVSPEEHWTGIEGLYAAGEVTGGLHGANRLGGNSLAEILIFGKRSGKAAAERSQKLRAHLRSQKAINDSHEKINSLIKDGKEMAKPLLNELGEIMWEHCGVIREKENMFNGLKKLEILKLRSQDLDIRLAYEGATDLVHAFDLEASILTAKATLMSSLKRCESRGAHQRSDFPEQSESEEVNYIIHLTTNKDLQISSKILNSPNKELKEIITKTKEIKEMKGKLIE